MAAHQLVFWLTREVRDAAGDEYVQGLVDGMAIVSRQEDVSVYQKEPLVEVFRFPAHEPEPAVDTPEERTARLERVSA